LSIDVGAVGIVFIAWLLAAVPTVVYLAPRKTDTARLTMCWGVVPALVAPLGLLFILALLLRRDRVTR
jgi:hypothetical protein